MRKYWNFDGSELVFQCTSITTRQKYRWTSSFYVFGNRQAQFTSFTEFESETFIEHGPLNNKMTGTPNRTDEAINFMPKKDLLTKAANEKSLNTN